MHEDLLSQLTEVELIPSERTLPDRIGHIDDQEYWNIYDDNQLIRKKRTIGEFVKRERLTIGALLIKNRLVLTISDSKTRSIAPEVLDRIVNQGIVAEKRGIINQCFLIAQAACDEQGFTGRIASSDGCSEFTGWGNHCINWHELNDGSVIGFDLTTPTNLAHRSGEFHVLLMHSQNLSRLQVMLNGLYGGDWNPIQSD